MIQLLASSSIDAARWDNVVASQSNGRFYALSAYLSTMCEQWGGIVFDDYKAVIPLPWKRKWGIRYIYTPPFIQQLGLIGDFAAFNKEALASLTQFARYGDYLWNSGAPLSGISPVQLVPKVNYVLDLSNNYSEIIKGYSSSLLRYLKQARNNELVCKDTPIIEAIELYQRLYQERMPHVSNNDFAAFKQFATLQPTLHCKVFAKAVFNKYGSQLATVVFIQDQYRIYNIMPSTLPEGRKMFAMHYLLDECFKANVGQQLLFDFEGSDIPGVKSFYEQFGGIDEGYYHWHFNHLPWPMNLLKR